jgi:hypothetical protein
MSENALEAWDGAGFAPATLEDLARWDGSAPMPGVVVGCAPGDDADIDASSAGVVLVEKRRARFPSYLKRGLRQAARRARDSELPCVRVREVGSTSGGWVVMAASDFLRLTVAAAGSATCNDA